MKLSDSTFDLYAAKYYDNPSCTDVTEFADDLNRIKYIRRLFSKYKLKGEIKERLVINHLIVLYNVFPQKQCTEMLMLKLGDFDYLLKPFLLYLSRWPTTIELNNNIIYGSDVPMSDDIVERLRKFECHRE